MIKPVDVSLRQWKFSSGEKNSEISIIGEAHNSKKYLFLTNFSRIIESQPPFEDFTRLQTDPLKQDKITAIAIANKSNLLALSFANGKILLFDIDKSQVFSEITKKSTSNIIFMKFTPADDGLISADSEGDVFTYSKTMTETRIYTSGIKAVSTYTPSIKSNYAFFNSKTEAYLRLTYTNAQNIIYSSPNNDPLSAFCNAEGNTAIYYTIAGNAICIFRVFERGNWEVYQYTVLPSNALEMHLLTPNVYIVIFSDYTIRLVRSDGYIGSSFYSPKLYHAIKGSKVRYVIDNKLYCFVENSVETIQFYNWEQFIDILMNNNEYKICLEVCNQIYKDENTEYLGVPEDKLTKRTKVESKVTEILSKMMPLATTFQEIADIIEKAFNFNVINFIKHTVFPLCKEKYLLIDYTNYILNKKHEYQILLTDELILSLADLGQGKFLKGISEQLMSAENLNAHKAALLEFAKKTKNIDMMIKMSLDIYGDVITPANIVFGKKHFVPFVERVLKRSYSMNMKKTFMIWLMTPIDGKFDRLTYVMESDFSFNIYKILYELLPIQLSNGYKLNKEMFTDLCLRIFPELDFAFFEVFIPVAANFIINQKMKIPVCAINTCIKWAFTEKKYLDMRENLVLLMQKQYPTAIIFSNIIDNLEAAGFSNIIKDLCLRRREYGRIIKTMAVSHERRNEIFPLILEHIEEHDEIKYAINMNLQVLILLNTKKTLDLIFNHFPDMHEKFLSSAIKPVVRYMYIRAIMHDRRYSDKISENDVMSYFALLCQFAPNEVLPMIKENHDFNIEKALPVCIKYHVVDACVHIYTMIGKPTSGMHLISDEIEYNLYTMIKKNVPLKIPTISRVAFIDEISTPYKLVRLAIDVLDNSPAVGHTLEKMWHLIFKAFQIPLWMACTEVKDEVARDGYFTFFSFFAIEALQRTDPQFIIEILHGDYQFMPDQQKRAVIRAIFAFLNQCKMLSKAVESLLLADCIKLSEEGRIVKSGGRCVMKPRCCVCNGFITGRGGIGSIVFPCGHMFHNNSRCGKYKRCPVCNGDQILASNDEISDFDMKISRAQRKLARIEYSLQPNFGDMAAGSEGNRIYFVEEFKTPCTQKAKGPSASVLPESNKLYVAL